MLGWAIFFFILAIIAAAFGFGGIAGASANIAYILLVVFAVLFIASLISYMVRGRRPPLP